MIPSSPAPRSRRTGVRRRERGDGVLLARLLGEELSGTSLEDWGRYRPWKDATRRLVEIRRPRWLDAPWNAYWFAHDLWSRWETQALAQQILDEVVAFPELLDDPSGPPPTSVLQLAALVLESVDAAQPLQRVATRA